jgi:hypothetical protein
MARFVAPALRALLSHLIDYAGLFPPASLPFESALINYDRYSAGENSWILGRFVVPIDRVNQIGAEPNRPLSVLSDTDHVLAAAIESKKVIATAKPTYCEVPASRFAEVKAAGSFAKIRTGGVTPESIPPAKEVAAAINMCAALRLPFKATAGLHHPVRSRRALTYDQNSPEAMMHGFLNLFLAAAFAWHGFANIEPILAEEDGSNFRFDEQAHWRDLSITTEQIQDARAHFAHSFGSCSFEEPVRELGL